MTNYELWRLYTKHIHAPRQFLDAAFYYMIGVALERRVWTDSDELAIFPNQYPLLCGEAGVGKGLAMAPVNGILGQLRVDRANESSALRLHKGPDAGSYEKITRRMVDATCKEPCRYYDARLGRDKIYTYTAMHIELDEFTSLFKQQAQDVGTFFCTMWDGASAGYDRDTEKHGQVILANPIMSCMSGTTPDNLAKLKKYDMFGSGLDRRMLIIYADRNEWAQFEIPERTPEQLEAGTKLVAHCEKLTRVVGPLHYTDEAKLHAKEWWVNPTRRDVNSHPLMSQYNENKNKHWHKYAIAMHMAEGEPAMRMREAIPWPTLESAIRKLHSYEVLRHHAHDKSQDNELSRVALSVSKWLRDNMACSEVKLAEIAENFYALANLRELEEVMKFCVLTGRVKYNDKNQTYQAIT